MGLRHRYAPVLMRWELVENRYGNFAAVHPEEVEGESWKDRPRRVFWGYHLEMRAWDG